MTQTLHILRKDARCFRRELGVVGALTVAFAWSHIAADAPRVPEFSRPSVLAYLTSGLLVIGWWLLVSQVIHAEALAGDRQFWITRPYSWKRLLGAKVLFVLAFVNAPLLVAQMIILFAGGYPPLGGFPKLLWMQFAATVVLLVPAFALGTVTRNFAQIVLTLLGAVLCLYFWVGGGSMGFVMLPSWWTSEAAVVGVVCAGAALVVRWQYSRRRTGASIFAGLCTVVLAGALYVNLPITLPYAVQSRIFRQPEIRAVSMALGQPRASSMLENPSEVVVELPFRFTNVPADEAALPEVINLSIEGPSGARLSEGWTGVWYNEPVPPAVGAMAGYWHQVLFDRAFYRKIADATATVQVSMYVSLQNATNLVLLPERATRMPWGGFCEVSTDNNAYAVFCSSPFRSPYDLVRNANGNVHLPYGEIEHSGSEELLSRRQSPWPAEFALSPVFTEGFRCAVGSTVFLLREEPRAWVRRDLRTTVRFPPMPEIKR